MSKRIKKVSKATIISFVVLSTILWSVGTIFYLPKNTQAAEPAPFIEKVDYINPTTVMVDFSEDMATASIGTDDFTLSTAASGDTETITAVTLRSHPDDDKVIVVASGAKISAASDTIRVATGTGAPAEAEAGGLTQTTADPRPAMPPIAQIAISEVKLSGTTATDEFIELYNPAGSTVDISTWKLTFIDSTGAATDLVTFAASTTMAAGKFRLTGPTDTTNADNTYTATGNGIAANGTVVLYSPLGGGIFRVVDMVGCGTAPIKEGDAFATCPAANSSIERKAAPADTAVALASGGAQANKGNGYDSNNNNFDFVTQTTPVPQYSGSTAETPGQITNQPPGIDHMPISQATAEANLIMTSMMGDPETPPAGLTTALNYSVDGGTTWTTVSGVFLNNNIFQFTILAANVPAAGLTLKYYLKVTDGATTPLSRCAFSGGMGECGTADATAKAAAWTVTSVDGSGWTNSIKGQTKGAGTAMNNVTVRAQGNGSTFTTLSATDTTPEPDVVGAFTLSGLPAGVFKLTASVPGYMESWFEGVPSKLTGAAYTDWVFDLVSGSGGQGGDTTAPRVIFSAPSDGMQGAPTKINIPSGTGQIEFPMMTAFSKDMDTSTINTSNILLKKMNFNGTFTAVTGYSVAYQSQNGQATLSDRGDRQVSFGPERKAIIYSETALDANTQYVVEIGANVKDTAGNPVQGNRPGGSGHIIFFTTSAGDMTNQITTTNFGTGGQYMPPYVTGTTPSPGAFGVPTNVKITVNFSEPMDSTSLTSNLKLYRVSPAPGEYVSAAVSLDTATNKIATLTPSSSLTAGGQYSIRVLGGAKSASNITMAPPDKLTNTIFQADFNIGNSADTGAPTVLGSSLEMYTVASSCSVNKCITNVPVNVGVIDIGFSKDMDSSTLNSSNITLTSGTSSINTSITYDSPSRSVKITPSTVLYTNTSYTLTITTSVKAMNGTAFAANYVASFTTSSTTDTTSPGIQFINSDDYKMAITFTEPMQSATAIDTANWTYSVLNPANYILYTDNGPPPTGQTALYFSNANLSTATTSGAGGPLTFKYDSGYNTVIIEGLKLSDASLTIRGGFRLWVKSVKDLSGNTISGNVNPPTEGANMRGGGVMNSQNTFGMIGPGGGGMMGTPTTANIQAGTMAVTDFGGKDPSMMGMKPIGVWPQNMLAGTESLYMIDIPLSQAIPAGGQIILTFPSGFNVANAQNADINKTYAHKDINGPGTGTVILATTLESPQSGGLNSDGVTVDATARTVTITLGAVATQTNDFLHLEIDRIKNSSISKDFNTSGYTVDIKTMSGTRTLESLTSMPFFIKAKGKYYLVGRITNGVGLNGVNLYGGSPETGPLKTTTANNAYGGTTDGEYQIAGLSQGSVNIMTEQTITVGATEYLAPNPEPLFINDTTTSNTVGGATPCTSTTACYYTKNIALTAAAGGAALIVEVIGTFSSEKVDIFAGGPAGFRVKEVTLNGTGTAGSPLSNTINLPANGFYMVGIGPAMPKGPMSQNRAQMPNWMPPKPLEVIVAGGSVTVDPTGPATGDTANDGTISFSITTANKTITGHVYDASGTAIANAEVFCYNPMGGFGTNATSGNDGAFTLNVTTGTYKVGASMSGMPSSQEVGVEVKDSTVYANGVATTDLLLKVAKSDYTISGKVTDGTNTIKDASVYAYRTDGPGHAQALTDSTGKYILYVAQGTWKVGVFLPGYGNLTEQTVTIPPSKSSLNFAPGTGVSYYTIKERIWEDKDSDSTYDAGEAVANAHVTIQGTNYTNDAITDSSGIYETKVPGGSYEISAWSPTLGKLPPQSNVAVSSDINLSGVADVMAQATKTVTVQFRNATDTANVTVDKALVQLDKLGSKDVTNEIYSENVSSVTLTVPSGASNNYLFDVELPGIAESALTIQSGGVGTTVSTSTVGGEKFSQVTVDGNETVKILVPDLYTVSGTVKDTSGTAIPDAIVHIEKPGTDIELDVQTNSSGNYTVQLPASGSQNYLIQADKSGYLDAVPASLVVDGNEPNTDLEAQKAGYTISGQVQIGSSGASNAYVYAEKMGGGFVSAEADTSGNYTLNVPAGDWKVYATGEGYSAKTRTTLASVSTSNVSSVNLTLDTTATLQKPQAESITPVSGGTFENTSSQFEMNLPPSSLGTSQSSYQIQDKEISNVPMISPCAEVIGGEAEEITAFDPNGTPVTTLSDEVIMNKTFTMAELTTAGMDTIAEIEKLKMTSYDETAQNWIPMPTTITYLDSSGQAVIPADASLSNVSQVLFNGQTAHFSSVAVTNSAPDAMAPNTPTGMSVTSPQIGQLKVTWTAPTTNLDGSALTDLRGYNVYRSTSSSGPWVMVNATLIPSGTTTYTDSSNIQAGVTYYYKVTADTGLESGLSDGGSGSSGGDIGGGGGGGAVQTVTPTPKKIVQAEPTTPTAPAAKPISQMTIPELQTEISRIIALIAQLQAELVKLTVGIQAFAADLEYGMKQSSEVKRLQEFLTSKGYLAAGLNTGNYLSLTVTAIKAYQTAKGISPVGRFGPQTRAAVNADLPR